MAAQSDIFLYTFGFGYRSTVRLRDQLVCGSAQISVFTGRVHIYPDRELTKTTPERVQSLIRRVSTPKLVIFAYRHDCVGSAENLFWFLLELCHWFLFESQTQLSICFPLPNILDKNHSVACLEVRFPCFELKGVL